MIIKDKLRLVGNVPNVISFSKNIINSFYDPEENSPRHIFVILELKKKQIKHFAFDKILDFVADKKIRESIRVLNFDYPLPVTYNEPTKNLIINLKALDVSSLSRLTARQLFEAVLYSYVFASLVSGKIKVSPKYAQNIVNYFLSFYTQIFGREYGLVSSYSSRIPKLKFLIACYVLRSFFGFSPGRNLFKNASSIAPYIYDHEFRDLQRYDFMQVSDFVDSLSHLEVMPGLTLTKFVSKLYRYFGINILPAIEDCSRFFSIIVSSSVVGGKITPTFLLKYNEKEYFNLIDVVRRIL